MGFGPGEVFGLGDNQFEFVGMIVNVADGRFERFWGEGDPVEGAGVGMGAGGFEVSAEGFRFEGVGEFCQIMNQRFAACDDDEVGVCSFGLMGELVDRNLRMIFIAPRNLGIAPGTTHVAEGKADEVGVGSAPCAFALDGVEGFDDR